MRATATLLIFTVALAAATPALAQAPVSIGQADMPIVGDTLRLSQGLTAGVSFQQTGPNQTWSYATLTPVRQRVAEFLNPLSGGGLVAFTFGPLGGVNRASVATPTQLPIDSLPGGGGFTLGDLRAYFRTQAASYKQVGFSAAIGGLAVPVTFAAGRQDFIYRLPLTYGSAADSSDSYFEANVPGTVFLAQQQNRVNHVDGWGALTTPFGTFSTIRVRTRLDTYDSLVLTGQMPIALQLPTRYEYKWLAPGQRVPLLTISTALVGGQETVTGVEYRDIYRRITFPTGLPTATATAAVSLSPNPAAATDAVQLRGLPAGGSTITVFDALGRVLLRRRATEGELVLGELVLSPADLGTGRGVLTVRVEAATGVAVRRLIRQ